MEGKSSNQGGAFCQFTEQNAQILNLKIFYHQVIAYLPYNKTEIVRFLKYIRNGYFLKKNMDFFGKKTGFFFKIGKGGKFSVECVSNAIIFQKCFRHFNYEIFCKIRRYKKKRVLFRKKSFHLFRKHL